MGSHFTIIPSLQYNSQTLAIQSDLEVISTSQFRLMNIFKTLHEINEINYYLEHTEIIILFTVVNI